MYNIGNTVEFKYDATTLKKAFLESGGNMLTISTNDDGSANFELYNELFPFFENDKELITDEMWKRMFYTSISNINTIIRKIVSDSYTENGAFDINDGEIVIPIAVADYNEADLQVADSCMYDALVFGAVAEWFTNSDVEPLIKLSKDRAGESLTKLSLAVRKLESVFLRKQINSPIFDSMI